MANIGGPSKFAALAVLVAGVAVGTAAAQTDYRTPGSQKADVCRGSTGGGCGSGSGSSGSNAYNPGMLNSPLAKALKDLFRGPDQPPQPTESAGYAANKRGVDFFNQGEWSKAVASFQEALAKQPNDPIILQRLANAQARLANAQAELAKAQAKLQEQQHEKAAAAQIQQSIQNFAQALNAAPSLGGLDFDGRTSDAAPNGLEFTAKIAIAAPPAPGCAQSGSSSVVSACNVPSGLTKDLDDAIAGTYANAPPGVSDRVRKGFQAVMTRDWKAAKAWFQDALNRDPSNEGLKRMVALAQYNVPAPKTAVAGPAASAPPSPRTYVPTQAETEEFVRNAEAGRFTQPVEVRDYFYHLPEEELKRVLGGFPPASAGSTAGQLKEEDVHEQIIFTGPRNLQQWRARAWDDLMVEDLIEQTRLTVPMNATAPAKGVHN